MARALAPSPATSSGLQRNGEEALRQAYADRLRCLGRKLAVTDVANASDETLRERHLSPDPGTNQWQSQLEVEALVQKVRQLCQERRTLKSEAAAVDERYAIVIRDLKMELEAAQVQYSEMRAEQARLRKRLGDVGTEQQRERDNWSRSLEDSEKSMQAEILQLEAACRLSTGRLATMQGEAQDYKRRLQQLGSEQQAIEIEATSVVGAASAAKVELEGLHERVRQSEAETQELEEKCMLVGKRFERVMEVSEKENREQADDIKARARNQRHKAEKHRKVAEKAKEKLATAQGTVERQRTILGERDATIQRLRQTCQAEREAGLKRQEQFFESQRKALADQAVEMQKRGGMMPMATHQKMMQEQGEWFANALRELEEALRRQQRSQEKERERLHELKEQERALREQEREQERQRLLDAREQERFFEERERMEFMEVEAVQSEASLKLHRLEEELQDAQAALVQTEASAAAVEEQRSALASSLEAVSGRLAQLRSSLESERAGKIRAQGSLSEARRRLDATHRSAANSAMQLGAQDDLRASWRRLEASWSEQQKQIAAIEQATSDLRRREGALQTEVAALHLERQQMETRLRSTQGLGKQLERQRASSALATRRKREEAARLKCLLAGHGDRSRRAASELKVKLREEQASLLGDLHGRMQQWKWAVTRDQAQLLARKSTSQETSEAARRVNDGLVARLESLRVADERLRLRMDSSSAAVLAQRSALERCHAAVRVAAADAEQLCLCIGSALPEGLTPSTVRGLLSGCGSAGEAMASPEALATLESELRQALEATKAGAVDRERQRWEEKSLRIRAESESAEAAQLAQLSEQRTMLEAELHTMELELRAIQERSNDCAQDAKVMQSRKEQLKKLEEQVARTKEDSRIAAERARTTQTKLEESKLAASLAEEAARKEARRPLQREIHEVNSQLETLRLRLGSDLGHQEAAWKEHFQKCERSCEAIWQKVEGSLREEVNELQRKLAKAPEVAEETTLHEASMISVQEELSASLLDAQAASSEITLLRTRLADLVAGTAKHREAIRDVERRTSEASDARRRDALEATEAERAAVRRHTEAMARMRQQCNADAANLEAEARFSLGSISKRISVVEGGAALHTHAELTAKAERLAERAKAHLETT